MTYHVHIILRQMIGMEVVRPTLDNDLAILSCFFLNGYIPGSTSFYFLVKQEENYTIDVNHDIMNKWNGIWNEKF